MGLAVEAGIENATARPWLLGGILCDSVRLSEAGFWRKAASQRKHHVGRKLAAAGGVALQPARRSDVVLYEQLSRMNSILIYLDVS